VRGVADVIFEDYKIKVETAINDKINAVLEECAGEIESKAKRNTRVKTGKTKNSWQHYVDDDKHEAIIGSNYENAIWEEFGTGEHAIAGDGRKGGWAYKDEKGDWHYTTGKKPSRAFYKAFTTLKNKIIAHIQNSLKGL
jgi:flagellar biosynthesis/type III secretory pathway M-ring protein FliF/YscJ